MKASRVFLVIMLAMFGFMLSNIDAAAIICGDDSTQTKTEPAATATSGATSILEATNEKSLSNQDAIAAELLTTPTPTTTTTSTETSEVKKIFKTVQCSLEKARPWVEEIEKEAKRLEETAKRFGEGVISRLGDFVGRLTSNDENTNPTLRLFNRFITGVAIVGNVNIKKVKPIQEVVIEKEQEHGQEHEQEHGQEHGQEHEQEQEQPVTEIVVISSSTTTSSTTPATRIIALADFDESENQINTDEK